MIRRDPIRHRSSHQSHLHILLYALELAIDDRRYLLDLPETDPDSDRYDTDPAEIRSQIDQLLDIHVRLLDFWSSTRP